MLRTRFYMTRSQLSSGVGQHREGKTMRDAPPIAEATKAVDRVDLENLGGTRGITELQERVRFDVAREIDQPVISDVVEGLFGALEKRERVRHRAHSGARPREERVGERHTRRSATCWRIAELRSKASYASWKFPSRAPSHRGW